MQYSSRSHSLGEFEVLCLKMLCRIARQCDSMSRYEVCVTCSRPMASLYVLSKSARTFLRSTSIPRHWRRESIKQLLYWLLCPCPGSPRPRSYDTSSKVTMDLSFPGGGIKSPNGLRAMTDRAACPCHCVHQLLLVRVPSNVSSALAKVRT